jgi:hypothetical protein
MKDSRLSAIEPSTGSVVSQYLWMDSVQSDPSVRRNNRCLSAAFGFYLELTG